MTKKSPAETATAIIEDDAVLLRNLQEHMTQKRNAKLTLQRVQRQQVGSRFLITNPNGSYIYRLYLSPGAFVKEVDFRVSLDTYYISRFHAGNESNVDLINTRTHETLANQKMSNLVLMKYPVEMGPAQIYRNLNHEYEINRFQPADRAQAMRPYEVSQAIIRAVGGGIAQLPNGGHDGHGHGHVLRAPAAMQPALAAAGPVHAALPAPPNGIHPHLRAPAPLVAPNPGPALPPPQGFSQEPVDNEPTRRSTRERRTVDRLRY